MNHRESLARTFAAEMGYRSARQRRRLAGEFRYH